MHRSTVRAAGLLSVLLLAACGGGGGGGGGGEPNPPPIEPTASADVGAAGGTLTLEGASLTVPAGALAATTTLTVKRLNAAAPAGFTGFSPVYEFGPAGTTFAVPALLAVTYAGSGGPPGLYWSLAGGGYERFEGTLSGGALTTEIGHFSSGFVGYSATGPSISGLSAAVVAKDDTLEVTGTHFTTPIQVQVGSQNLSFPNVVDATTIRVTIPDGALGGRVKVTVPAGAVTTRSDVRVKPQIAGFLPFEAGPGATLRIDGDFTIAVTEVRIGGATASFTPVGTTRLDAIVPVGATTGTVEVSNANGTAIASGTFTRIPPPTATAVAPSTGASGAVVTIDGTEFRPPFTVTFGGVGATVVVMVDETRLRVTVPQGALPGPLEVTSAGGTVTALALFAVTPRISGFSPLAAFAGDTVTLTGDFAAGVSEVRFDQLAASFAIVNPTTITATVPAAAGTGPIRLVGTHGEHVLASPVFTRIVPPTIGAFTPAAGKIGRTEVRVSGTGFVSVAGTPLSVRFGGVTAASLTVDSDTQLRAVPADGTADGPIQVTTVAGTATSAAPWQVVPRIDTAPGWELTIGAVITLTGASFGYADVVLFDSGGAMILAAFSAIDEGNLSVTVPAGATTGYVTVGRGGVGSDRTSLPLTVRPFPTLSGFTPAQGAVGSTVVLSGANFTPSMIARLGATQIPYTFVDSTRIEATVPINASNGPLSLTGGGVTSTSAGSFRIIPAVTSLSATTVGPGDLLVVNGSRLNEVDAIRLNGTLVPFTFVSEWELDIRVPHGLASGKLSLTSDGPASDLPVVTALSPTLAVQPSTGPAITSFKDAGGATITAAATGAFIRLVGSGFAGATAVHFTGQGAGESQPPTVLSSTELVVAIPLAAATGPVTVTTPLGTGTSPAILTVTDELVLSDFSPKTAIETTWVTVTGVGFTGLSGVLLGGAGGVPWVVDSDTQLRFQVPLGSAGGLISIMRSSVTRVSAEPLAIGNGPYISSVTPASAGVSDCTWVSGLNLGGATAIVRIGGVGATIGGTSTSTSLSVCVSRGTVAGPIEVTTASGTASAGFTVTGPVITSFTPNQGPTTAEVQISGVRLNEATEVIIAGVAASFTLLSDTLISATVPSFTGGSEPIYVRRSDEVLVGSVGNFRVSSAPAIATVSPAHGGAGTSVVISGYSFGGATAVRFGGVDATTFTVNTVNQIVAVVPSGAQTGPVTVTSPTGTGSSTEPFYLDPAIASFAPASGVVGDTVTITGSNFDGISSVRFGGIAAAGFTYLSPTEVTAVVPPGAIDGAITVLLPAGTSAASPLQFDVVPSITSVTPSEGIVGTTLTVRGHGLALATTIEFNSPGGFTSPVTVVSDTELRASIPAGATTSTVRVNLPGDFAESAGAVVVRYPPSVIGFLEESLLPGQVASVLGSNLAAATSVELDGVPVLAFTAFADHVLFTVPDDATSGLVRVVTPDGEALSPGFLQVLRPPTIALVSPLAGAVESTVITIDGTHFTGVLDVAFVDGGVPVSTSYNVVSDTLIYAAIPDGVHEGFFRVTTTDGVATSVDSVRALPRILYLDRGSAWVLEDFFVTGTSLAHVDSATINGIAAGVQQLGDTLLRVTVPRGATTGPLILYQGTDAVTHTSLFSVNRPRIDLVEPAQGTIGDTVVLTGVGFVDVYALYLGDVQVPFANDSGYSIRFTVPANGATGTIRLLAPQGLADSTDPFVVDGPAILGFSPASGTPGTQVTITGAQLDGFTAVHFNGRPATAYVRSATELVATVPADAASGPISVTTPSGTAVSFQDFFVLQPPTIASFAPAAGVAGTTVTVLGSGFAGASAVTFNGTAAASFAVLDGTTLTAVVPAAATTGPIRVTTSLGTATSATAFTVTPAPAIASYSPVRGPVGTIVTLTGANFGGVTQVLLNGVPVSSFAYVSATTVTALVAPGSASGPFSIVTPGGTATTLPLSFEVVVPSACSVALPGICPGNLVGIFGQSILEIDPATGDTSTVVTFPARTGPQDLALGSDGKLYVAAGGEALSYLWDGKILKVDPQNGSYATLTSVGGFNEPMGIAIDLDGTLLVADPWANALKGGIFRVDPVTGATSIVATGNLLTSPRDVVVEGPGSLLVVCQTRGVVRVITATGEQWQRSAPFYIPHAMALVAQDEVVVGDASTSAGGPAVWHVDLATARMSLFASGDLVKDPFGVAFGNDGTLYVNDRDSGVVAVNRLSGAQRLVLPYVGTARQIIYVP